MKKWFEIRARNGFTRVTAYSMAEAIAEFSAPDQIVRIEEVKNGLGDKIV